jgi:hypothetical protein
MSALPAGFKLDVAPPAGFVLDEEDPLAPPSGFTLDDAPPSGFTLDSVPTPKVLEIPAGEIQPRHPGIGRVLSAVGEGASEAIAVESPLGFTDDMMSAGRKVGLFRKDEKDRNPFRLFNEMLAMPIASAGAGADLILRSLEAPIVAGVEGIGQTAEEFGMDQGMAQRLKRDLYGLLLTVGVVSGTAPVMGRSSVIERSKLEVSKRADKLVDEAGKDLQPFQREQLRTQAQVDIDSTVDAVFLASAKEKIGQPTVGEVADTARFSFKDKAITDTLDAYRPIKVTAVREALKRGDTPDLSPYVDLRLLQGIEGQILAQQRKGTLGISDDGIVFTGPGLIETLSPISGNIDNGMLYFAGKRAQELSGRGIVVPFSQPEIAAMVRLGERDPNIAKAFEGYQAYNRRTLDFAEQAGLLSKEKKAALIDAGQSYVPYYRAVTDENMGAGVGASIFKRLKGGEANVNEILDNINRNTIMWVDASLKNRAKLGVYNMIERFNLDDVAERMPDTAMARLANKDMEKALTEMGFKDAGDLVPVFSYNRQIAPDIDVVFRNGKAEVWKIKDPLFRKAIQNINPEGFGLGMQILSGTANVLRRGVTLSPDFMVKNLIRDTQAAFIQSQTQGRNTFIPFYSSARGMVRRVAEDDIYWEAMANGAGFATTFQGETALNRNIKNFYGNRGINYGDVLDSPKKVLDTVENMTSSFEQASRLEEFALLRAQGATSREAAFGAREVASDFGARGAAPFVRNFTATVPFLNARMQGLAKMAEVAVDQPFKVGAKALTGITLPSLALYYVNKDDPEYKALPDWVRDQHWAIPKEEGGFYLIPKGFEWGAIYASTPERMFEAIEQEHGKALADFMLRTVFDTFAVGPPQIVAPALDVSANRKFTGAPVVPADLENVKPSEQFRPWTSESMVQLSQAMSEELGVEFSPLQAEHLVSGYFGTLGMYALTAADAMLASASGKTNPTMRLDEVPLLRSFMRQDPMKGSQYQTDFYDLMGASREVVATVNKMTKEGRSPNLSENEKRLFALSQSVGEVSSMASAMNAAQRLVMMDESLSAEEKRERIDGIQRQRNQLFLDFSRGLSKNEEIRDLMKDRGLTIPPRGN